MAPNKALRTPAPLPLFPRDAALALVHLILDDDPDLAAGAHAAPGGEECRQLYGAAYARLRSAGADHPLIADLRREYQINRLRIAMYGRALQPLLAAFAEAGIPVMLLKGMALSGSYYPDAGRRMVTDIDAAVRPACFADAIALLEGHGWRSTSPFVRDDPRFIHAVNFRSVDGIDLDLHAHPFHHCIADDFDALVWDAARPVPGFAGAVRMGREDQLLHCLAHGAVWTDPPPYRWVLDAMAILRADGAALDWALFWRRAGAADILAVADGAIGFLQAEGWLGPVPRPAAGDAPSRLATMLAATRQDTMRHALGYNWSMIRHTAARNSPAALLATAMHYARSRRRHDRGLLRRILDRIAPR